MAHMESAQVVKVFDNQQAFTDELKEVEAKAQLNLVAIGTLNGTAKLLSRREMHFWHGVSFALPDVPANSGIVTRFSDSSLGVKFGVEFYNGPDSTNASKFVIAVDMLTSKGIQEYSRAIEEKK